MLVSYQPWRGEKRGKHKAGTGWEGRGDCVDCNLCVNVCPVGVDIRDGEQMECINCALCIDACNSVMKRVGRPSGLIRYDTYRNLKNRTAGKSHRVRLLRPRTFIYAALFLLAAVVILGSLVTRADTDISVQRDRNPLFVQLSDGSIRNGFTVKIINKSHHTRTFMLTLSGLDGARMDVLGLDGSDAETVALVTSPDALETFRIFIRTARANLSGEANDLTFVLRDPATDIVIEQESVFRGPER